MPSATVSRTPTKSVHAPGRLGAHAVLAVGAALMIAPLIIQITASLKTYHEAIRVPPTFLPASPQWHNYSDVSSANFPVWRQLFNTAIAAAARVAGQLLFCSMAAFAFARLRFPGRGLLFAAFLSVLMVPSQLFLIPQYQIMQSLGWLDTIQALFVPGMFSAFGVFLLRQFFMTLPTDLDEAAKLDGCNPFQIYWRILLPLMKPALIALSLLTLVSSWNDLLWPLIVNSTASKLPIAAGLASQQGQYITPYQKIMAGALIATVPMILTFAAMQRQFIAGIAAGGTK
jgi:multiple sugar transport system permease protein